MPMGKEGTWRYHPGYGADPVVLSEPPKDMSNGMYSYEPGPGELAQEAQAREETRQRSADVSAALRQHWADQEPQQEERGGILSRIAGLFHDRRDEGRRDRPG